VRELKPGAPALDLTQDSLFDSETWVYHRAYFIAGLAVAATYCSLSARRSSVLITACRLTFSSLASRSSSSSMDAVKSTFTRWTNGGIIFPSFVKKREMSSPLSAGCPTHYFPVSILRVMLNSARVSKELMFLTELFLPLNSAQSS